eukprot:12512034-Alexandrium_andersonii.AAC.1
MTHLTLCTMRALGSRLHKAATEQPALSVKRTSGGIYYLRPLMACRMLPQAWPDRPPGPTCECCPPAPRGLTRSCTAASGLTGCRQACMASMTDSRSDPRG